MALPANKPDSPNNPALIAQPQLQPQPQQQPSSQPGAAVPPLAGAVAAGAAPAGGAEPGAVVLAQPQPPTKAKAFYASAKSYGTLDPMPKMPGAHIGPAREKPPPLLGCFSDPQFNTFTAKHQLDDKRLSLLDLESYQSACRAFGVSLDPLVVRLLKLRVTSSDNYARQEAKAAREFVHKNFLFKNQASVTATQTGGGNVPAQTSASKREGGVKVLRRDGADIDMMSLSVRLGSVANSLKNNSADTSKREAGVVKSLSYDYLGRPVGDLEQVVVLVLLAISDVANQLLYRTLASAEAFAPFENSIWPGIQFRSTVPSDSAERTGYFTVKDGELQRTLSFRSWVIKTTPDKMSATEFNMQQEILSKGITTFNPLDVIQGCIDNAAKDLGSLNIIPRLQEGASQTMAKYLVQNNYNIVEFPIITAPVIDDATGLPASVYVPAEFMTSYHSFKAKGVVATVTFRMCEFTTKSQQLAVHSITLCGAVTAGAGGIDQARLDGMNDPDAALREAEQNASYQLMLQLSASSSFGTPALTSGDGDDDDDDGDDEADNHLLALAAAQAEADHTLSSTTGANNGTNAANAASAASAAGVNNISTDEPSKPPKPADPVVHVPVPESSDAETVERDGLSEKGDESEPVAEQPPPRSHKQQTKAGHKRGQIGDFDFKKKHHKQMPRANSEDQ